MNGQIERHLNLTIHLSNEDVEIDVCEPESGRVKKLQFPLSFDEHPNFDKAIGRDIYSWLILWSGED